MTGFRTYTAAAAILLKGVFDQFGFTEFTGAQISNALDIVLVLCVIGFRYLATRKAVKIT